MTKNGITSRQLTLVDHSGREIPLKMPIEDDAVVCMSGAGNASPLQDDGNNMELNRAEASSCVWRDLMQNKVLFAVVSITCLTAAVATGSYAVWLSRRKATEQAVTTVHELLDTCQDRMQQLEKDLRALSPQLADRSRA
ncbi:MAG: hypothetical protein ACLQVD_00820 [Capsulimonadaceae bacterium]